MRSFSVLIVTCDVIKNENSSSSTVNKNFSLKLQCDDDGRVCRIDKNYENVSNATLDSIIKNVFIQFLKVERFTVKNVSLDRIDKELFANASNLKSLTCSFNELTKLVDDPFSNAWNLEILNLQYNQINWIDAHAFFNLSKLQRLNLSFNKITSLAFMTLRSLKSLTDLDLRHNLIRVISKTQFERNLMLAKLHLENNRIVLIDAGTFDELKNIEVLDLRDNACIDRAFNTYEFSLNRNELRCCTEEFAEHNDCDVVNDRNFFKSHLILIGIIFVLVFGNIFVVSYFFVYKRKVQRDFEENFEMLNNEYTNGEPYQVY